MTYFHFLLLFLALPIGALALVLRRALLNPRFWALAALLMGIALVYMAPWDHTAAVWHLWTWSSGQTWGIRWWNVPPEEYLFAVLESLLAVMLCHLFVGRRRHPATASAQQERAQQAAERQTERQTERQEGTV